MIKDIRLLPYFTPPTKEVLIKMVLVVAKQKGCGVCDISSLYYEKDSPQQCYLLILISSDTIMS